MTANDREAMAEKFYIDDHAMLFAHIVRSAEKIVGSLSKEAVVKGIVAYGRERGLRIAMRCLADGEPLSGKNYILYGEWADDRGWAKNEVAAAKPHYCTATTSCPWCETWRKHGIIKYGRLYCDWVDGSLLYGFNPGLRLDMPGIMAHDDPKCEFEWLGCVFENESEADEMASRRAELIPRVTKDFLYHTGHLLSAMRREIFLASGLVKGRAIIGAALAAYGKEFGEDKAKAVTEESHQDFLKI